MADHEARAEIRLSGWAILALILFILLLFQYRRERDIVVTRDERGRIESLRRI